MPETSLTDCPYYLVTRASLAVTAHLKRALGEAGIANVRPSYLSVLMSLWRRDGLQIVELGRRAGLEPSSMTGVLDRMERDGLVIRTADPGDRRAQRIRLTGEALRVKPVVMRILDATLDAVLDGIALEDLERMKSTLQCMLANTHRLQTA